MNDGRLDVGSPQSACAAGPVSVAVPAEGAPGERRVALVPRSVTGLRESGLEVAVERGAGAGARIDDEAYRTAGATVVDDAAELFATADVVLTVGRLGRRPDGRDPVDLMQPGSVVAGLLDSAGADVLARLARRGVTAFALERMPRITRAQEMDVLSSMSTIAGYHAVLRAAVRLPRFFPLLMTAAGTVQPARVLVIGAGVAGLQAIATAHRLGASVEAYDVRPAVREQVQSLGARFIDIPVEADAETAGGYARALSAEVQERQRAVLAEHVAGADVVITTALVPGRPAPLLVTAAMVAAMRPGSVIVDLAAESGGNCELSAAGREVEIGGVIVDAPIGLPSLMAVDASRLYSHNISRFVQMLTRSGGVEVDLDDEIVRATCAAHAGRLLTDGRPVGGEEAVA